MRRYSSKDLLQGTMWLSMNITIYFARPLCCGRLGVAVIRAISERQALRKTVEGRRAKSLLTG
jgi:hypothetical protein